MATHRVPVLENFEYQPSVIALQSTPPGTPAKGDRYIVGPSATGDWSGSEGAIAYWDGSFWQFDSLGLQKWVAYVSAESKFYFKSGAAVWTELDMKPKTHAASHKSGGADAIKLDELAEPTDITTLDASTSKHGLLKKLPGGTTNYLRADGSFAAPPGVVPTGTGFRKVVAGVEDAAAKLVENAEVHASAAIAESKLALNYATHSPANDPSAGEKAALPGTSGTPSGTNKYVTNDDSRNANARTPVAHEHAGVDISSGTVDGDRLPALSATKKGGAPATGTPTGKFLKDDNTWATPGGGGDMQKSIYDTDADNIVDKAEAVDDGAGNATTAAQVKEAYTKRAAYDADYKCLTFTI
jgi:hypothetical protein